MKCYVYRAAKKEGAYLYVTLDQELETLPGELIKMLGKLEPVMELDLSVTRKLANADIEKVKSQLSETSYYLQLPPQDYNFS